MRTIKLLFEIVNLLFLITLEHTVKLIIKCKPIIHFVSAVLAVFVLVIVILVAYKCYKDITTFGQVFPQVLILSALFYVLGMLSITTSKEGM